MALVTGSGTGIGRSIAELFAREGARVVINYRSSREAAEEAVRDIQRAGGVAVALAGDVSREKDVLEMMGRIEREFGRLDFLINNAGWSKLIPHPKLDDLTDEVWDRTMNTNLRGAFYCCRAAAPLLRRQDGAAIINIASIAGYMGMGSSMAYAASKAGMLTMTKSLARALAPQIRVNAIAPGLVRTAFADWPETAFQRAEKITPLQRLPTVEDAAATALFLATARSITGEAIVLDGGYLHLGPVQ